MLGDADIVAHFFRIPSSKSVYMLRSCASSIFSPSPRLSVPNTYKKDIRRTMMTLYLLSRGSTSVSRKSMPSVMYLMRVRSLDETSSNRMVYPTYVRVPSSPVRRRGCQKKRRHTSSPRMEPTSVATREATDVAATRRGCVHATTFPSAAQPASYRYCGSSAMPSVYATRVGRWSSTDESSCRTQFGPRRW
jgi:hypothetical protein